MNNNSIKHFLRAGAVCCGMAAALVACSDWNDHYDGADLGANGSDLTLWQTMKQQPQLSDFCEVLQQTKVFRQHKKTSVSYADLLDGGQSFTVMAPVNGTFNKDSLLQLVLTNQGDSMVEKSFVLNHLSRATISLTGHAQQMRLANTKRIEIGNGKVGDIEIATPNIHAHNGILHVMKSRVPYAYNLYEAMTDLPQFQFTGAILRQYEEDYLDENNSLSSGMIDGIPVYVDSVIIERNRMLERVGLINAEDSTYLMVVPSTDGWKKAWTEVERYFVYDESVDKRDSLQQYWTNRALLDDAVFSMTVQASPQDSLISPQYNRRKPEWHVFYNPFTEGIMSQPVRVIKCSNGTLYETAQWPFTPEQTYFRELKSEGEETGLITDFNLCSYNTRVFSADSVSENGYLDIVPASGTSNWNVAFKVQNTLAGTYDICAIVLPKSVYNTVSPDVRPYKFRASVSYVDEAGRAQEFNCNNATFISDPLRVDTIVLARAFSFPVCNYDQVNNKVTVKLTCNITARETSRYAREMFLDCIYLRPTTKEE